MAATSIQRYTKTDFETIKQNGFTYDLPEYALMLINKISKQVGAPSYIKTPIFRKHREHTGENALTKQQSSDNSNNNNNHNNDKRRRRKKHGHGGGRELTDEEWTTIRNFESTKMEQAKNECDKALNNIRSLLNKLSDSNYDTIKDEFLFAIYELEQKDLINVSNDENNDDNLWNDLCNLIIDTSCTNAFYSKQYVNLVTDFYKKYSSIGDTFKAVLDKNIGQLYDIKYVDPDQDYDEFCKNNILSERRKSLATFISNLYAFDLIQNDRYRVILENLLNTFGDKINEQDVSFICDELSEVIYNIIGDNHKKLFLKHGGDLYKDCMDKIVEFGSLKRKKYKSLTNKALFKFCDMIDDIDCIM